MRALKKLQFWGFILLLTLFSFNLRADEGMWIPLLLQYNEAEMQQMGFKLTADDIYSVNHHSMKDAIVLFGGGCTAELISANGLLLTNHHCGYSYVQRHSTIENNYLHNGFWAKSYEEEIPNPGLSVTFLVEMRDVTHLVLEGTSSNMSDNELSTIIESNIKKIKSEAVQGTHYEAVIKPFYYGNQYFLFINEIYKDVRLVGVPPESIGKFGGDTDNWMWPRHTGDFSLYRIYSDKEGNPAEYSKDNIPLKSKKFFPISIKGVEQDDFTLVVGYPGTTQQFLISDGVDLIANVKNPIAITQRGARLDIMKKYMDKSIETRLMYSAKANSISNGWKKWIGESKGIKECNVIQQKIDEEKDFMNWVHSDSKLTSKYGTILSSLKQDYAEIKDYQTIYSFVNETFPAIELFNFLYNQCYPFILLAQDKNCTPELYEQGKNNMIKKINNFYKSYNKFIDEEIFVSLLTTYFSQLKPDLVPNNLQSYIGYGKAEWEVIAHKIYHNSIFTDSTTFINYMNSASAKNIGKLSNQLVFKILLPAYEQREEAIKKIIVGQERLYMHYQVYVQALMEKDKEKVFYPDANLTMRVTYGQVKGFNPKDGVDYVHYTTIDGIMEKENPDIFDYKVDPKLKQLYETKDYGRYTNSKGELPVAFIASNHTTGGNSGSPVINANGELIGVNFDRVWEGTMSDVKYDVSRCRNISLDIRYFLFIVDRFANAQNIINELNIIQ